MKSRLFYLFHLEVLGRALCSSLLHSVPMIAFEWVCMGSLAFDLNHLGEHDLMICI